MNDVVVNELKDPSLRRIDGVILASVGLAFAVYLAVATNGYHSFGDKVQGDVLDNYPGTALVSVARCMVALLVTFSFPLQCHPSRQCVLSLLGARRGDRAGAKDDAPAPDAAALAAEGDPAGALAARREARRRLAEHAAVTTAFLAGSLTIALLCTSLTTVLSVVGATGSTAVSYILPGGIYYRLAQPSFKRTLALCQFCLGCAIVPAALTMIFIPH